MLVSHQVTQLSGEVLPQTFPRKATSQKPSNHNIKDVLTRVNGAFDVNPASRGPEKPLAVPMAFKGPEKPHVTTVRENPEVPSATDLIGADLLTAL